MLDVAHNRLLMHGQQVCLLCATLARMNEMVSPMHINKKIVWSFWLFPVTVLMFCTGSFAQDKDPCEVLKLKLETGWPEESPHSPEEIRAIIAHGEADLCDELVLTISLSQEPNIVGNQGYLSAQIQTGEINSELLAGTSVYGMDDVYIGAISSLTQTSDGNFADVIIELGGFMGIGAKSILVASDQLVVLREEDGEELRAYIDSTQEEIEQVLAYESEEIVTDSAPVSLNEVRASRTFVALDNNIRTDFAGFGIVAFRRSPVGSLSERAKFLCNGFILGVSPVSVLVESGIAPNRQVVTTWPVKSAEQASQMNENAKDAHNGDMVCNDAIARYDWAEGDQAIAEAADYFRARGKYEIAERLALPDQDGPWLLAWAPGTEKGSTHDDVLVLAFDLSYVATQVQAERAFQAWRVAIEQNPELWSAANIANQGRNSAIIRWVNMIGRDLDFYNLFLQ